MNTPPSHEELESALRFFKRSYLMVDDKVLDAVKLIKAHGTPDDQQLACDHILKMLAREDTGPDYDHAYQLDDGRVQMHAQQLNQRNEFYIQLLAILDEPQRVAKAVDSFPAHASGLACVKEYLRSATT